MAAVRTGGAGRRNVRRDSRSSERTVHVTRVEAVLDERLCDPGPALEARAVHRGVPVLLGDGNVGTLVEQVLDRPDFAG